MKKMTDNDWVLVKFTAVLVGLLLVVFAAVWHIDHNLATQPCSYFQNEPASIVPPPLPSGEALEYLRNKKGWTTVQGKLVSDPMVLICTSCRA